MCPAEIYCWLPDDTALGTQRIVSKYPHAGIRGPWPAFFIPGGLCEDMVHRCLGKLPPRTEQVKLSSGAPSLLLLQGNQFYKNNSYISLQNNSCHYLHSCLLKIKLTTKSIKILQRKM